MKKVKIISDYTSFDEPNFLQLIRDNQGDVHINMEINSDSENGVRIASSGTRHSQKVREAFYNLIEAIIGEESEQMKKYQDE